MRSQTVLAVMIGICFGAAMIALIVKSASAPAKRTPQDPDPTLWCMSPGLLDGNGRIPPCSALN